MIKINLLPWREELREERKQRFFLMLGVAVFIGLLIMAMVHLVLAKQIKNQVKRNQILIGEIAILDQRITEIKKLESTKASLLARMSIIERLQSDRPLIVRLFKELIAIMPEGIHLTRARRMGNMIALNGYAESNTNISNLMRKIERSNYLAMPKLNIIKNTEVLDKKKRDTTGYGFELFFVLINPEMMGMF